MKRLVQWVQECCLEACPYRQMTKRRLEALVVRLFESTDREDPKDLLEELKQHCNDQHPAGYQPREFDDVDSFDLVAELRKAIDSRS